MLLKKFFERSKVLAFYDSCEKAQEKIRKLLHPVARHWRDLRRGKGPVLFRS